MLSKSMRDEEVITETVLCMAGKKCSPTSAPLDPGATCPKNPVALNPTVWIYCGSKKCKKKVLEAVRHLGYLNHFLFRFYMEAPHASLHAPWPAAEECPPQSSRLTAEFDNVSFAIQDSTSGLRTICGSRARFTIETSNGIVERYSTIGGLIVVKNSLFAMTTAHAIVNCFLERSYSISSDETESTSNASSDAASDCDRSSDSGSDESTESSHSPPPRMASEKRPSIESREYHESKDVIWTNSQLPKILAYMNRGTIDGDHSFPIPAPSTSDFALVDSGSIIHLSNEYCNPDHNTIETISDHIPTRELLSGDVWVITSCGNAPVKGFLLEGDASVILRGTIMRTKKIQVPLTSAHGLSGSWVVREGKLCGVIYAAYDLSPYLHMLPAERMFQDIAEVVQTPIVRVANAQDIYEHKSSFAFRNSSNEDMDQASKILDMVEPVLQHFDVPREHESMPAYGNEGRLKEVEQPQVQGIESSQKEPANVNPTAAARSGDSEVVSPTAKMPATNPKMRRRSRTGCLTCRKRRIKCGEERPTCTNCIKSKRQCEGYNQRVTFKPVIGDWPNHPIAVTSLHYHTFMSPGTRASAGSYHPALSAVQPQDEDDDNTLTSIQPRPITQFDFATEPFVSSSQSYRQDVDYQQPLSSPHHQPPLHLPHYQIATPTSAASYFPQPSPVHATFQGQYTQESNSDHQEEQQCS
ncbi:hypothetical protein BKA63DRAFT_78513 [Paraphoma chrysanthemicola]|nr:hypothetical protein BKA63DRAFT_78513 [Paraphoma chrysanthemicola]